MNSRAGSRVIQIDDGGPLIDERRYYNARAMEDNLSRLMADLDLFEVEHGDEPVVQPRLRDDMDYAAEPTPAADAVSAPRDKEEGHEEEEEEEEDEDKARKAAIQQRLRETSALPRHETPSTEQAAEQQLERRLVDAIAATADSLYFARPEEDKSPWVARIALAQPGRREATSEALARASPDKLGMAVAHVQEPDNRTRMRAIVRVLQSAERGDPPDFEQALVMEGWDILELRRDEGGYWIDAYYHKVCPLDSVLPKYRTRPT